MHLTHFWAEREDENFFSEEGKGRGGIKLMIKRQTQSNLGHKPQVTAPVYHIWVARNNTKLEIYLHFEPYSFASQAEMLYHFAFMPQMN